MPRPHVSHETYLFLRAECDRLRRQLASVSALADYWYERVTYTDAEITEMRDRARDAWYQAWWDAGMPTEYPTNLYPEQEHTHA